MSLQTRVNINCTTFTNEGHLTALGYPSLVSITVNTTTTDTSSFPSGSCCGSQIEQSPNLYIQCHTRSQSICELKKVAITNKTVSVIMSLWLNPDPQELVHVYLQSP
jgi:hypothetical protein